MERNENFGSTGTGEQALSGGTSGTPSQAGSQGMGSTGYAASGDAMPGDRQGGAAGVAHHLADKATSAASQGKEALADRLGSVKEKASDLKTTLADKLEQGAEALRNRAQAQGQGGAQYAGAAGAAAGLLGNEKVQGYSNQLAGGLQGAADMLRDGDLQGALEKQVRENPARTLLIALGLGYVIGKAVRK